MRQDWVDLKSTLGTLDRAELAEKHLVLVNDVRTMITHAGDMSNLILDPDLDSYYLMDATLLALPADPGAARRRSCIMARRRSRRAT